MRLSFRNRARLYPVVTFHAVKSRLEQLEALGRKAANGLFDDAERHPFLQKLRGATEPGLQREFLDVPQAREEDNWPVAKPRLLPELTHESEAILPRHLDIHDNQVRLEHPCPVDGCNRIGFHFDEEVSSPFEKRPQKLADGRFIVDAKNSGF